MIKSHHSENRLILPLLKRPKEIAMFSSKSSTKTQIPSSSSTTSIASFSESVVSKKIPKIDWDDFLGVPNESSRWLAYTTWHVLYNYRILPKRGKNTVVLHVHCLLKKKKSWVKWRDECLLNHERGHYLMGWICALEFKRKVQETKFGGLSSASIEVEISRLFKVTRNEIMKLEKLYDEETKHYRDREKQKLWDEKIAQWLEELKHLL